VHALRIRTFVARTIAPKKIRSRTRVMPNDSGSRCSLARLRYTSVTKSVETLDCEESITELTKCAKIHRSPVTGGAPRMRGVMMDERSRAKVPTHEVLRMKADRKRNYIHANEVRACPLGRWRWSITPVPWFVFG